MKEKVSKIVKAESGYWVGKELYPGEQYISFDSVCIMHELNKIVTVDLGTLSIDLRQTLGVEVSQATPENVVRMLARELCNSTFGMLYLLDYKAPFGVRKVIDAPAI